MPALTLAIVQVGFIARMTRASMLEVLNQDFIRTADAKGLPRTEIMLRHGLPNALIPILTVAGIVAGALLGGAVIIEQVFSIPGVGRLIIGGILSRDYPVIQGGLLFLAVIYLAVNLSSTCSTPSPTRGCVSNERSRSPRPGAAGASSPIWQTPACGCCATAPS